jgi:hypothetical protein
MNPIARVLESSSRAVIDQPVGAFHLRRRRHARGEPVDSQPAVDRGVLSRARDAEVRPNAPAMLAAERPAPVATTTASRARLDVRQTRGPDSLSRAIVLLMSGIEPRKGGHENTKTRKHEKESWSGCWLFVFSVFVFSCLLAGGFAAVAADAADAQVRVESLDGGAVNPLDAPSGTKAIVFLFTSTDCPISNRYAPEVRRLAEKFARQGVVFRLVYPNPDDKRHEILEHMSAFGYTGVAEALRDPRHALVKFTGVAVTPEAAVYVGGRVVYHGRIDNRFVDLGLERPAATVHDLDETLTAALAGRPIEHSVTQAVGCYIADFR